MSAMPLRRRRRLFKNHWASGARRVTLHGHMFLSRTLAVRCLNLWLLLAPRHLTGLIGVLRVFVNVPSHVQGVFAQLPCDISGVAVAQPLRKILWLPLALAVEGRGLHGTGRPQLCTMASKGCCQAFACHSFPAAVLPTCCEAIRLSTRKWSA